MAVAIRMPDFGTAVNEVRLVKWLAETGARVERGTLLAEVETDKAATELESVAAGVLLKQCVPDGTVVASGQLIAWVGQPGEELPGEAEEPREAPLAAAAATAPATAPPPAARIAPVVANLARKLGVDLSRVRGTGEHGAITREDVTRAARAPEQQEPSPAQAAVARAVSKSNAEIPHLRIAAAVDMTAARRLHESGIGYDAIFLKAMARAQEAVPAFAQPGGAHIAVAVGFGTDLLLPVIRDAGSKRLPALTAEIASLAARARQRALRPEEMAGASMALSNLGMYPIEWFEAIIFPGHTSILAVGAAAERPVAIDGRIEARFTANVTLSADHRIVNGRTAAEYLTRIKQLVESGEIE